MSDNGNESSSSSDLEIVTGVQAQEEETEKALPQEQQDVDINKVPMYDGKPLIDVDLEEFADKPWAKPGCDVSDFFNYGFNEDSWKAYCEKQRQLRQEYSIQMHFDKKRETVQVRPEKRHRYDDYRRQPYARVPDRGPDRGRW
eukprot:NODE_519_length_7315_cov_0.500554.p5 type:complete len:143 gc:universal NODE_519_length_7315_cov_0.500554:6734-6306(-)